MKKVIFTLIAVFGVAMFQNATAQKVKTIKLEQTTGEFDKTELNLKAGKTYQFEVTNNGVDHEVGFVLAPANNTEMAGHIKEAYLKNTVMDGKSAMSGEVTLEAGEYVFFCPMNPTPQYKVMVK
jgi:plastocyanin